MNKPKIFIIVAVSADGFIAKDANHYAGWSSKEDKAFFARRTKEAGVIVMGSRTFDTIGRPLPGRRTIVLTSRPDAYANSGAEATSESPSTLIERLSAENVSEVAICGGTQVYSQLISSGLVDELYITVEPVLFGSGLMLFNTPYDVPLRLISEEALNENSRLLHYAVQNPAE